MEVYETGTGIDGRAQELAYEKNGKAKAAGVYEKLSRDAAAEQRKRERDGDY